MFHYSSSCACVCSYLSTSSMRKHVWSVAVDETCNQVMFLINLVYFITLTCDIVPTYWSSYQRATCLTERELAICAISQLLYYNSKLTNSVICSCSHIHSHKCDVLWCTYCLSPHCRVTLVLFPSILCPSMVLFRGKAKSMHTWSIPWRALCYSLLDIMIRCRLVCHIIVSIHVSLYVLCINYAKCIRLWDMSVLFT